MTIRDVMLSIAQDLIAIEDIDGDQEYSVLFDKEPVAWVLFSNTTHGCWVNGRYAKDSAARISLLREVINPYATRFVTTHYLTLSNNSVN